MKRLVLIDENENVCEIFESIICSNQLEGQKLLVTNTQTNQSNVLDKYFNLIYDKWFSIKKIINYKFSLILTPNGCNILNNKGEFLIDNNKFPNLKLAWDKCTDTYLFLDNNSTLLAVDISGNGNILYTLNDVKRVYILRNNLGTKDKKFFLVEIKDKLKLVEAFTGKIIYTFYDDGFDDINLEHTNEFVIITKNYINNTVKSVVISSNKRRHTFNYELDIQDCREIKCKHESYLIIQRPKVFYIFSNNGFIKIKGKYIGHFYNANLIRYCDGKNLNKTYYFDLIKNEDINYNGEFPLTVERIYETSFSFFYSHDFYYFFNIIARDFIRYPNSNEVAKIDKIDATSNPDIFNINFYDCIPTPKLYSISQNEFVFDKKRP